MAMALLDTAMAASEAKAAGQEVTVIRLNPCSVQTFDFSEAQSLLAKPTEGLYGENRRWVEAELTAFCGAREAKERVVPKRFWLTQTQSVMEDFYELYVKQHHQRSFRYVRRRFCVTAYSLLPEEHPDRNQGDVVRSYLQFAPSKTDLDCLMLETWFEHEPSKLRYQLVRSDNTELPMKVFPARKPGSSRVYAIVFFFTPPLCPEEDWHYTLTTEYRVPAVFPTIREPDGDEVHLVLWRVDGDVEMVEAMAIFPKEIVNKVGIQPQSGSAGEMHTFSDGFDGDIPVNFKAVGMVGKKVPANAFVGFNLSLEA